MRKRQTTSRRKRLGAQKPLCQCPSVSIWWVIHHLKYPRQRGAKQVQRCQFWYYSASTPTPICYLLGGMFSGKVDCVIDPYPRSMEGSMMNQTFSGRSRGHPFILLSASWVALHLLLSTYDYFYHVFFLFVCSFDGVGLDVVVHFLHSCASATFCFITYVLTHFHSCQWCDFCMTHLSCHVACHSFA